MSGVPGLRAVGARRRSGTGLSPHLSARRERAAQRVELGIAQAAPAPARGRDVEAGEDGRKPLPVEHAALSRGDRTAQPRQRVRGVQVGADASCFGDALPGDLGRGSVEHAGGGQLLQRDGEPRVRPEQCLRPVERRAPVLEASGLKQHAGEPQPRTRRARMGVHRVLVQREIAAPQPGALRGQ